MKAITIVILYLCVLNCNQAQVRHLWKQDHKDDTSGAWIYGGGYTDPMNGFLVGGEEVYHTTNGGLNWVIEKSGFWFTGANEIACPKKNYAFVATEYGVSKTTDGGKMWQHKKIFKDSVVLDSRLSMFDENNGGVVVISYNSNQPARLIITEDGWETSRELAVPRPKGWENLSSMGLHRVVCIAPKVYLLGVFTFKYRNMFCRTTDAGATWSFIADPTRPNRGNSVPVFRYSFINEKEGMMVGPDVDSVTKEKNIDFQLTKDGGLTWEPFAEIKMPKNVLGLIDFVYLGNGKMIYKTEFIYRTVDGGKTFSKDSVEGKPYLVGPLIHNEKGGRGGVVFAGGIWQDHGEIPIKSVMEDVSGLVRKRLHLW